MRQTPTETLLQHPRLRASQSPCFLWEKDGSAAATESQTCNAPHANGWVVGMNCPSPITCGDYASWLIDRISMHKFPVPDAMRMTIHG